MKRPTPAGSPPWECGIRGAGLVNETDHNRRQTI